MLPSGLGPAKHNSTLRPTGSSTTSCHLARTIVPIFQQPLQATEKGNRVKGQLNKLLCDTSDKSESVTCSISSSRVHVFHFRKSTKARKLQVMDLLTQSNITCVRFILGKKSRSSGNSDAHLAIRGERIPSLPAVTSDAVR